MIHTSVSISSPTLFTLSLSFCVSLSRFSLFLFLTHIPKKKNEYNFGLLYSCPITRSSHLSSLHSSSSPPRFLHVLPCSLPCRILSTRRPPQTHAAMTQSLDFPCLSLSGAWTPGSSIQGHRHFSPTVGRCVGGGEGMGKRKCGTLCWSLSPRLEFVIRIHLSPLSLEPACLA